MADETPRKEAAAKTQVHYEIINAYADMVQFNVRQMMKNTEMCRCDKCFNDVCCIVYNHGFSYHIVREVGDLQAKVTDTDPAQRVKLMVTITEAIEMVKAHPRHDDEDSV